jgi:Intein/homing endonuclease
MPTVPSKAAKRKESASGAQSDLDLLETVQRMLLRMGIASTLYRNRRPAGETSLPDGHGGSADYRTKAQHELAISKDNVQRFAERIGFMDTDKQARLGMLLNTYIRRYNRERFLATVESLTAEGTEEVFDIQVPGVNAFDANGFFVHNCGEQPLLPYESAIWAPSTWRTCSQRRTGTRGSTTTS